VVTSDAASAYQARPPPAGCSIVVVVAVISAPQ
jgi:hypothetical protein